jgi:hypothetical protein
MSRAVERGDGLTNVWEVRSSRSEPLVTAIDRHAGGWRGRRWELM